MWKLFWDVWRTIGTSWVGTVYEFDNWQWSMELKPTWNRTRIMKEALMQARIWLLLGSIWKNLGRKYKLYAAICKLESNLELSREQLFCEASIFWGRTRNGGSGEQKWNLFYKKIEQTNENRRKTEDILRLEFWRFWIEIVPG